MPLKSGYLPGVNNITQYLAEFRVFCIITKQGDTFDDFILEIAKCDIKSDITNFKIQ